MNTESETMTGLRTTLRKLIEQTTADSKSLNTAIPGLSLFARTSTQGCATCVIEPSISLIAHGKKSITVDNTEYSYDPEHYLLTTLSLPASVRILEACQDEPYLGLTLRLEPEVLRELILQQPIRAAKETDSNSSVLLGHTSTSLLDSFVRLVSLLNNPEDIVVLAPLIKQEIYWRLLTGEHGEQLSKAVSNGSKIQRITKAIERVNNHYPSTLRVEEMAQLAQMSPSSFYQHFRQLTSMSPLQYQKYLRLIKARQLLFTSNLDAAKVASQVGYESASQFSREYSRLFGAPPKRDIDSIKQSSVTPEFDQI